MEKIYLEKSRAVKQEKSFLEKKLNVKITITGRMATIEGSALSEYEAEMVFEAINFGFSPQTATLLVDEDFIFTRLNMKDFTRRKKLDEVRARLIGKKGQTKRVIEEITSCKLIIKDKEVGIIGDAEGIQNAITGITNLIRGSKQSNVYKFLEKNKNKS